MTLRVTNFHAPPSAPMMSAACRLVALSGDAQAVWVLGPSTQLIKWRSYRPPHPIHQNLR
jgi:hypothetical protein